MKRTWTPADVEAAVIESTKRSGVPLKIEDPSALATIATVTRKRPEHRRAS